MLRPIETGQQLYVVISSIMSTFKRIHDSEQLAQVGGGNNRKMKPAVSTYPLDVVLQCLRNGKCMFCVFSCDHGQILNIISVIHLEILEGFAKVLGEVLGFLIRRHVGG